MTSFQNCNKHCYINVSFTLSQFNINDNRFYVFFDDYGIFKDLPPNRLDKMTNILQND